MTGKVIITNGDTTVPVKSPQVGAGETAIGAPASATGPWKPADLRQFVGKELGVSSWITLDQARINEFARCTQDEQWIHVDVERAARESPFGGTIAHAFLSLSMIPATIYELFGDRLQVQASLNYGLDRTRFMSPVKAGQRVRNRIKIVSVEDKGAGRWLLTTENTFEIEGQEKPAIVAISLGMLIE